MKKRLMIFSLLAALLVTSLAGCASSKDNGKKADTGKALTKVTLNEVAHSIFYAPMYVAIEEGYFKEEGIELTLVTGFGVNWLVQDISIYFRFTQWCIIWHYIGCNPYLYMCFFHTFFNKGGRTELLPVYICDDVKPELDYLTRTVEKIILIENYDMDIICATQNPDGLLQTLNNHPTQSLYFLDIDLNHELDGFRLAKKYGRLIRAVFS